jgi:signal transduction histidine kinase
LGLRGIRERAEGLGGSLTVESSPGEGTTVAIALPAIETPDSLDEVALSEEAR